MSSYSKSSKLADTGSYGPKKASLLLSFVVFCGTNTFFKVPLSVIFSTGNS